MNAKQGKYVAALEAQSKAQCYQDVSDWKDRVKSSKLWYWGETAEQSLEPWSFMQNWVAEYGLNMKIGATYALKDVSRAPNESQYGTAATLAVLHHCWRHKRAAKPAETLALLPSKFSGKVLCMMPPGTGKTRAIFTLAKLPSTTSYRRIQIIFANQHMLDLEKPGLD